MDDDSGMSASKGTAASDETLLSPGEIARRCRLSLKTVYRAIGSGELRASRICNRLRVRPTDLNAWIDASRLERPSRGRSESAFPAPTSSAPAGSFRSALAARAPRKPA